MYEKATIAHRGTIANYITPLAFSVFWLAETRSRLVIARAFFWELVPERALDFENSARLKRPLLT